MREPTLGHNRHEEDARAGRELPPAARRALEEAAVRRAAISREALDKATEIGGRGGPDPARYGDWEIKGKTVDF